MAYEPRFTVTSHLVKMLEEIAVFREKIMSATIQVPWVPALQKEARARNTHSSTAIEGNPLTLEEVRVLEEGQKLPLAQERSKREVLNYFAALRYVEKHANQKHFLHEDIFILHHLIAAEVMDQGKAGGYRTMQVRVGNHMPPPANQVSPLMRELLEWWNQKSSAWSPVITSAVIHYRFEDIHPFADGNGRTGRMLALWELYRRGFDTHHLFSVDEVYWEKRQLYYQHLDLVRREGNDLTSWLEYSAEALHLTLERVWGRIQHLAVKTGSEKIILRPKQEKLLALLRDKRELSPSEIWKALAISKQGAMDLINPLVQAGLVRKVGTKKMGRYVLGRGVEDESI
jgi:Fic family protein